MLMRRRARVSGLLRASWHMHQAHGFLSPQRFATTMDGRISPPRRAGASSEGMAAWVAARVRGAVVEEPRASGAVSAIYTTAEACRSSTNVRTALQPVHLAHQMLSNQLGVGYVAAPLTTDRVLPTRFPVTCSFSCSRKSILASRPMLTRVARHSCRCSVETTPATSPSPRAATAAPTRRAPPLECAQSRLDRLMPVHEA